MNKDKKPGQTPFVHLRSDIRALIDKCESNQLVVLNALAALFIAKCARRDESERMGPVVDERDGDDALLQKLGWPESAVTQVGIALRTIADLDTLPRRVRRSLRTHVLTFAAAGAPETYFRIVEWLHALDMSTHASRRLASEVFDEAIRFSVRRDGRLLGQFITPEPVADLMLELANPIPGETVYDPCFGFGGLLAGAIRRLRAAENASRPNCGSREPAISGVETRDDVARVATCRLMLAGIDSRSLVCADALNEPPPTERSEVGFDCILASPPWGEDSIRGYGVHVEDLFLQHAMAHLSPGGRAVVALPERPLFHGESAALREELLSEYRVEGVVALPAGAFAPFTDIPISLVVVARAEPRETVRFLSVAPMAWGAVMAEAAYRDGDQERRESLNESFSHDELLREISDLIGRRRELSEGTTLPGVEAWDVAVEEVVARDYELLAKKSGSEVLDDEIDRLVKANPSLRIERLGGVADMDEGQTYDPDEVTERQPENLVGGVLRPGDLVDAGIRSPSLFLAGHAFDYGAAYGPAFLRGGDVLVPMTETIGTVGFIEESTSWAGVMANDDIALVRVRDGLAPQFLVALLRSPAYWFWLSGHAAGSTIRRLSVDVLRTLPIPVPPPAVQETVLRELSGTRGDALAVLYRLFSGISEHPVAAWLETPIPARLAAGGAAAGAGDGLRAIAEIARGFGALKQSAGSEKGNRLLDAWLSSARRAAAALDGIDSIPPGAGRLAVLEFALVRLHEALAALGDEEGHVIERLRSGHPRPGGARRARGLRHAAVDHP